MPYALASAMLGALGVALVIAGLLYFRKPQWILGWLKGMAVCATILTGLYTAAVAINMSSYQPLEGMQVVASLSIQRQGDQLWLVTLQPREQSSVVETLYGDQWQLDARILRFTGPLAWFGIASGYQLERLSGRYTTLEQERSAPQAAVQLGTSLWPDLWEADRAFNLPFIEGISGNATFMPMGDGARFDIRLSSSGLVAVPVNDAAQEAVRLWNR